MVINDYFLDQNKGIQDKTINIQYQGAEHYVTYSNCNAYHNRWFSGSHKVIRIDYECEKHSFIIVNLYWIIIHNTVRINVSGNEHG